MQMHEQGPMEMLPASLTCSLPFEQRSELCSSNEGHHINYIVIKYQSIFTISICPGF